VPNVLSMHPEALLAFAGDGEKLPELKTQCKSLGIDGQVRFLGYRKDVPDLIAAADLFVFPSVQEGFGSSLVDAMLAGVPIVATTAGGIPDVTGSDDASVESCAWAVEPGNPQALSQALLQAVDSPDTMASYRDRALRRAHALFTADRMVEATLNVYRELLASPADR
jgi:glycosyltransferase involved in cell wall biosynthesis